jgi:hypothetical protein
MAKQPASEGAAEEAAQEEGAGRGGVRVRWDTSKMTSTYANVCNVSSTREEVTLLFGTNQTWFTGQEELKVDLSDRIVLNPYAAKRLSILLNNVMKEYENRFGKLPVEAGDQPQPGAQS